jgi:hypothetical protein
MPPTSHSKISTITQVSLFSAKYCHWFNWNIRIYTLESTNIIYWQVTRYALSFWMVWADYDNYSINQPLSRLKTINAYHFMDKIQYCKWNEIHFDLKNDQLKIQCEVFTCESIGGLGLKMKPCRERKRSWKEGEGGWCCALRIAFSKCLPQQYISKSKMNNTIFYTLRITTSSVSI